MMKHLVDVSPDSSKLFIKIKMRGEYLSRNINVHEACLLSAALLCAISNLLNIWRMKME